MRQLPVCRQNQQLVRYSGTVRITSRLSGGDACGWFESQRMTPAARTGC
jgi:hypothetical protein